MPTITITPKMATAVPIQKIALGFSLKIKIEPSPTHMGAKLASNVEIEALDNRIEVFHSEISQANKHPQKMAVWMDFELSPDFLRLNHNGSTKTDPMAIL